MAQYEIETCLLIHLKVKVIVEADSKDAALDAAADALPANYDMDRAKKWGANVTLKAPKGVQVTPVKVVHFEQTGGGEKVRKLAAP